MYQDYIRFGVVLRIKYDYFEIVTSVHFIRGDYFTSKKIQCRLMFQICGLYPIKLAMALVIAGGMKTVVDENTKMRGESHLLLVGDPGLY